MSDVLDTETDKLADGTVRTVTTMNDYDKSILDDDWYGELVPVGAPRLGNERPSHFDGRARKISPSQMRDAYWWQPPKDVADEHLDTLRHEIQDLLDYGYVGIGVEVELPDGGMGSASLWGIGAMDTDYHRQVIQDLTEEAMADAYADRNRRMAKMWNTTPEHAAAILDDVA
jgi:hypothetical protein